MTDEDDREETWNEWIAHVLEHGEQVEREDETSQHYSVDVRIVVCEKDKDVALTTGQKFLVFLMIRVRKCPQSHHLPPVRRKRRKTHHNTCSLYPKV